MSWNIGNAILQPGNTKSHEETGESHTLIFKDAYTDLDTKRLALKEGDVIETGWVAKTWTLRPVPGGYGELTINCVPDDMVPTPTEEDPDAKTQEPLKDLWSIKSVRNDVSVMAYCGDDENEPDRAMIEAWMKEPDGELAKRHAFRKPDGEVVYLVGGDDPNPANADLVAKIEKGIESVIRFYPVVTRKRTYSQVPPACLENIGFIDTPPAPAGTAKKPNGLATAIAAHQWLKVQDDADEQADGNWMRIEAWMGIPKTDANDNSPWDADLYGPNRWQMPHNHHDDSDNS